MNKKLFVSDWQFSSCPVQIWKGLREQLISQSKILEMLCLGQNILDKAKNGQCLMHQRSKSSLKQIGLNTKRG
jgi:hypothetical protein